MYVCLYVCAYRYVHTHSHIHTYIHTYVYTYTHTHIILTGDKKAAAELYWTCRDYIKAITLLGSNGWLTPLMDKIRTLNKV